MITIIILLILAGVSISLVLGNNGILNRATNAVEKHREASAREKLELALGEAQITKYIDGLTEEELDSKIEDIEGELIPKEDESANNQQVIVDGYVFEIDRSVPKIIDYIGLADGIVITATISGSDGWVKPTEASVSVTGTIKTYSGGTITNVTAVKKDGTVLSGVPTNGGNYTIDNINENTEIEITATDSNGKTKTKTIPVTIKIDETLPTVETVTAMAEGINIKISATGHDKNASSQEESGIDYFTYTIIPTHGIEAGKNTGNFKLGETITVTTTIEETYTVKVTATDKVGNGPSEEKVAEPVKTGNVTETETKEEFSYTGDYQEYIVPEDGYYKVQCWGASGGNASSYVGGKGAYTEGIIYLSKDEKIYVYVGEQGSEVRPNSKLDKIGFNGGGNNKGATNQYSYEGTGGGATDIRIVGGKDYSWNNFESLKSRLIVAAGGGGAASTNISGWGGSHGGYGGAVVGGNGACAHTSRVAPTGGTQTSGGLSTDGSSDFIGSFGLGGTTASGAGMGSGGGGYYGGAAAKYAANTLISGAGGSSFISGYAGCDAISATSTEDKIEHTGSPIHNSGRYFVFSKMFAGNESMPNYNGEKNIVGNTGNGYAKITKVILK